MPRLSIIASWQDVMNGWRDSTVFTTADGNCLPAARASEYAQSQCTIFCQMAVAGVVTSGGNCPPVGCA